MMRTIKKEHTLDTRTIGSLEVSIVGLGCNNFGWRMNYEATAAVVHAALDAGITFFDTADIYGDTRSEEYLGRALGPRRNDIVLATKFGMAVDDRRRGARPEYIRQAAEDSLRRLGTDHIDLYQLHQPDPEVPIADTLGALDELVRAGKVREIGCSNFSARADSTSGRSRSSRRSQVRQCAEWVQSFAAGSRTRRATRMRTSEDCFHSILPTGKRPPHGKISTGSTIA